ncbi:fungal-specific transcription factor domain-containing protein [Aspergillus cavernicola]|uniref:Fungal-specific transcription factor domain-containing protein n=1 Tax=Aspergillus cavernicola TaxID=176166 RepID=A0ABR4ITL9_9EURO
MALVDGGFEFHNATTPSTSPTNAIPGGQQREKTTGNSRDQSPNEGAGPNAIPPTTPRHQNIGFIGVFLMVIAIGLQYAGPHRQSLLASHNVDADKLSERIFSAIRAKLLDILSFGSLEAVQACILLGTYYLFHGNTGLAWPACGYGLRIAQALNLHRKLLRNELESVQSADWRNRNGTRKRCWWAIYEIETFCSMSYGYPHSIKDADCDVDPLDPSAKSQFVLFPTSFDEPLQCDTTLLYYKYFMSKLSVLIKIALAELYHIGPGSTESSALSDSTSSLHCLVQRVAVLDAKLQQWRAEIPAELRLESGSYAKASYSSIEELDMDVGASGPRFENHIFQLQALALKLAYENARFLFTDHFSQKELTAILDVERPMRSLKPMASASLEDDLTDAAKLEQIPLLSSAQQSHVQPNIEHTLQSLPEAESVSTLAANTGDLTFQYVEDPALSQAVFDFDQVVLTQAPLFREVTPMSASL